MITESKRISVVLSNIQLDKINLLQQEMDIDLSKVVRWCVDTCFDLGTQSKQLNDLIGPEHSVQVREIISTRSSFLLDSIAKQVDSL